MVRVKEDLILTFSNCIHVKKTYPFQLFWSFPTNVCWLTHTTILAGIYLLKVSNKNKTLVATMPCINDINQLKDYISYMSSWKNNIFHDKRQCKVLINNYKEEFTCWTTNHPTSNFSKESPCQVATFYPDLKPSLFINTPILKNQFAVPEPSYLVDLISIKYLEIS